MLVVNPEKANPDDHLSKASSPKALRIVKLRVLIRYGDEPCEGIERLVGAVQTQHGFAVVF